MVEDSVEQGIAEAVHGRWEKASRILERAGSRFEGKDDRGCKLQLSKALRWRAYVVARLGEFQKGVSLAKRAMEISASIDDIEGEADALRRLGSIHFRKGDFNMAIEFYDVSLEKANAASARGLIALAKIEKGNVLATLGSYGEAERAYMDAVKLLKQIDDISELIRAYNNLGSCLMDQGKYEEAIETFRICLGIADNTNDELRKGWACMNIGACSTKMGMAKDAIIYLDKALALLTELDDKIGVALIHLEYGLAHWEQKDLSRAETSFKVALTHIEGLQMPTEEAEAHMSLGKVYLKMGKEDLGKSHLAKAMDIYEGLGLRKEVKDVESFIEGA